MNLKKGVIAIVLFVFLSLTVYSFANPAEDDSVTKLDGGNTTNVNEVENEYPDEENILEAEVEEDEEVTNRQVLTTESSNNVSAPSRVTSSNVASTTTESTNVQETTVNTETIPVEEKEDYKDVITLVDNLEDMVETAIVSTEITDMDKARDYNKNEKIKEMVSTINDEETKNDLNETNNSTDIL